MPGNKYTAKQERKADHIEDGYREKGMSKKKAEQIAWATVNKQDGGGKNPGGSGRKKSSTKAKSKSAPSKAKGKRPTSKAKSKK